MTLEIKSSELKKIMGVAKAVDQHAISLKMNQVSLQHAVNMPMIHARLR